MGNGLVRILSAANHSTARFATRIGLLLSILGIAVGTGNIWRFPRIAAQNAGPEGAGAFLLAWLAFLLVWSIPLIIAEYALGRRARAGVVLTFARVLGPGKAWLGGFVAIVATAIMFYYSVVAGWCIYYFFTMLSEPLPLSPEVAATTWSNFQTSGLPVAFHAVALGLGAAVIWRGVRAIERVNMILIPLLLCIILFALVRTLMLDGAFAGIQFLFTPDFSTLAEPKIWLEALTQNAWDTGAGWGLILTYAAYMQSRHGIVRNAIITGVGNNLVSLCAAVIIFGTVFAILGTGMSQSDVLQVMQTSGPASTGLTFIWMPQLFARMPLGELLATLFFLGLAFAAFSSLISMLELATRVIVDLGVSRGKALSAIATTGFLAGIPSAINLNIFANQDFVWGVGLMISGAFIAYAVTSIGATSFRVNHINDIPGDWPLGRSWDLSMRFLIPAQAVILLGWWLYQAYAVYAPDSWYNPLDPFSVMTCIAQWGIAMALLLAWNRRWRDRLTNT